MGDKRSKSDKLFSLGVKSPRIKRAEPGRSGILLRGSFGKDKSLYKTTVGRAQYRWLNRRHLSPLTPKIHILAGSSTSTLRSSEALPERSKITGDYSPRERVVYAIRAGAISVHDKPSDSFSLSLSLIDPLFLFASYHAGFGLTSSLQMDYLLLYNIIRLLQRFTVYIVIRIFIDVWAGVF